MNWWQTLQQSASREVERYKARLNPEQQREMQNDANAFCAQPMPEQTAAMMQMTNLRSKWRNMASGR